MADSATSSRRLLTAAEVALRLRRTVSWFYRQRAELEDRHGFPRPIDGCGMRWDPRAIDRWLDSRIQGGALSGQQKALAEAEARLMARADAYGRNRGW
ncbi:helix-turn-helix transcriptional regulator [Roseomonas sp. F4]